MSAGITRDVLSSQTRAMFRAVSWCSCCGNSPETVSLMSAFLDGATRRGADRRSRRSITRPGSRVAEPPAGAPHHLPQERQAPQARARARSSPPPLTSVGGTSGTADSVLRQRHVRARTAPAVSSGALHECLGLSDRLGAGAPPVADARGGASGAPAQHHEQTKRPVAFSPCGWSRW